MEEDELIECRRSHGGHWNSESDSDFELTKEDLDKLYKDFEPPPIKINPKKHTIITLCNTEKDTEQSSQDQKTILNQQALLSSIMHPAMGCNGTIPKVQAIPTKKKKKKKKTKTQEPRLNYYGPSEDTLSDLSDTDFSPLGTTKRINNEKEIFQVSERENINEKTTQGKKKKWKKAVTDLILFNEPSPSYPKNDLDYQNSSATNDKANSDKSIVLTDTSEKVKQGKKKKKQKKSPIPSTPVANSEELKNKFLDLHFPPLRTRGNKDMENALLEENHTIPGTILGSKSEEVEKSSIANGEVVLTRITTDLGETLVANYDVLKKKLEDYDVPGFPPVDRKKAITNDELILEENHLHHTLKKPSEIKNQRLDLGTNVNSGETGCLQEVPEEQDNFLIKEQALQNQVADSIHPLDTNLMASEKVSNTGDLVKDTKKIKMKRTEQQREEKKRRKMERKMKLLTDQSTVNTDLDTSTVASQNFLLKVAEGSKLILSKELVAEIQRINLQETAEPKRKKSRRKKRKWVHIYSVRGNIDFQKEFPSYIKADFNDFNMIREIENYETLEARKKLYLRYCGSPSSSDYNMYFSTGYSSCLYQGNYFDLVKDMTDLKPKSTFYALSVGNVKRIVLYAELVQSQPDLYSKISKGVTAGTKFVDDDLFWITFLNLYLNESKDYKKGDLSNQIKTKELLSEFLRRLKLFFSDKYTVRYFLFGVVFLRYYVLWFPMSVIHIIELILIIFLFVFTLLFVFLDHLDSITNH